MRQHLSKRILEQIPGSFEMVMAFEEAFEVEIPSEDLEQITTVGDVVKYIESHK